MLRFIKYIFKKKMDTSLRMDLWCEKFSLKMAACYLESSCVGLYIYIYLHIGLFWKTCIKTWEKEKNAPWYKNRNHCIRRQICYTASPGVSWREGQESRNNRATIWSTFCPTSPWVTVYDLKGGRGVFLASWYDERWGGGWWVSQDGGQGCDPDDEQCDGRWVGGHGCDGDGDST